MSERWIWTGAAIVPGLALCIYGNKAFVAVGIIAGLFLIAAGGFFFMRYLRCRGGLVVSIALAVAGVSFIVFCAAFPHVAFFLGGIVFLALSAAVFLCLKIFGWQIRVVYIVFSMLCAISGIIILISPSFINFFSYASGAWMVLYGGVFFAILS